MEEIEVKKNEKININNKKFMNNKNNKIKNEVKYIKDKFINETDIKNNLKISKVKINDDNQYLFKKNCIINNFNTISHPISQKALNKNNIPANHRHVSRDKLNLHHYMNLNSPTNDTSTNTNSLKISPPKGTKNFSKDISKFRPGLLSAGGSTNNNIMIPIIPINRPYSNVNFGSVQLWNKKIINESNFQRYNSYNKSRNNKTHDGKKYNTFIALDIMGIREKEKILNKLHKIKIEKGMMNSGLVSSINKRLIEGYQNRIKQFQNSYLPIVFNAQNKTSNFNN